MTLNLVPTERSCHKVYSCEIEGRKSYQLNNIANVKVFGDKQTDKQINGQIDGQTDRPKTICPQSTDAGL